MNSQDVQKRVLLATVLSFAFFIAYDFLYLKPNQIQQEKIQKTTNYADNKVVKTEVQSVNTKDIPVKKDISKKEIVSVIKTKKTIIEVDNLGRIAQVILREKQYHNEDKTQIKLFDANQLRPLEVRFKDQDLNKKAFSINVNVSSKNLDATTKKTTLIITQNLGDITLKKELVFYPDGHYDAKVYTNKSVEFFITNGYRPDVLVDNYADHGLLLKKVDKTLDIIEDGDIDKVETKVGINIVSSFDRYYTTAIYNFNTPFMVSIMPVNNNPEAFVHTNKNISFSGYIGPKEYNTLANINPELTDIIEYGWFTFIAKPMFALLKYIHNVIGNWGWAIVIITILIKLLLYPLTLKGMKSMNKLKELAPKIKEIQERYKNDPQKASMHMMELYKKHDASPMGGCLPMLLQIPVFFALYRVLVNAIELKGAPWILWIKDLAEMDPYFVLPILMGISMYIQQKITPQQIQDEMQQKIFQYLPVVFTIFFLWFPAGLTLYWFVNNVLTIAQQYYVNKIFEREKKDKK